VVNAVTKDGSDVNGAEVKLEGGTENTVHGNALVGFTAGGWDFLGDLTGFSTDGQAGIHYDGVDDAAHNFGNIDNKDKGTNDEGFFKASKGEFTAEFDFEDRAQGNEAATYLTDFTNPGTMDEHRINGTLSINHDMGSGQTLDAMVYYGHYGYWQDFGYAAAPPTPAYEYTTTAYDDWYGEDVHYDWQVTKNLRLLAGADGTEGIYAHQHDYDTLQGDVLNINNSYNQYALFAQAEWQATDWLSLTAGGRTDWVQRLGTNNSPRLAAIVTPEKQDTFKLLYGRAFREPNLYELFYDSPGSNTPNPELRAEVIDTYELDWERQYANGWGTSLSGYLWHMRNAMDDVTLGDGSVQTQNVGSSTARGIEAEVDKRWDTRASFRYYGTYTWAQELGTLPPLSPAWITGAAVVLPFNRDNYLSVEPQIVGPMKSDLGQYTRATYITNIVFTSEHVFKNWTFQMGVYNLFANGAQLPHSASFEQFEATLPYPETQFLASMTCKF
jgi:iron complex outermembrane receptor protein